MSTTSKMLTSLAQQFAAAVDADRMRGAMTKVLVSSALAMSAAVATTEAMAQQTQSVLPQQSGIYWGQMLGQVLGATAGAVAAQNIENQGVAQVVTGVATEVGRNLGGMAAKEAYQPSGSAAQPGAMPLHMRDRLDNAGLAAAFAFDQYAQVLADSKVGRATRAQLNDAQSAFWAARDALTYQARDLQSRGYGAQPWFQLSNALSQNVISKSHIAELAQPMAERLNRPGGPGYVSSERAQSRSSLSELRARVEARQPAQHVIHTEYESPRYH